MYKSFIVKLKITYKNFKNLQSQYKNTVVSYKFIKDLLYALIQTPKWLSIPKKTV